MITAERKPLPEIKEMIQPFRKILVVGCGSCVAECASGGEKEVGVLSSALRMNAKMAGQEKEIEELTLDRQCVYQFIDQLTNRIDQYDAILSLGCGAGVQAVAEVFPESVILPALNTTFIGETQVAVDNQAGPVLHMYSEFKVSDRSWGLISRPGYYQSLADYLARQIVATMRDLYRVST